MILNMKFFRSLSAYSSSDSKKSINPLTIHEDYGSPGWTHADITIPFLCECGP